MNIAKFAFGTLVHSIVISADLALTALSEALSPANVTSVLGSFPAPTLPLGEDTPKYLELASCYALSGEDLDFDEVVTTTYVDYPPEAQREDGKKKRKGRVCERNRGKFLYLLSCAAKNQFGGTPSRRDSNRLAVMRFLVAQCEEHKLTVTDTRRCVQAALALVFTPDEDEIESARVLNCDYAHDMNVRLAEASTVDSWWLNILKGPLEGKRWKRAYKEWCGMPPKAAITFAK